MNFSLKLTFYVLNFKFLAKHLLLKIKISIFALKTKITKTFEKDILYIICSNDALYSL
ncbi:hypothetical protein HMPREF9420_0434 [Segatella salivae DSM 15606]|uniref:Uncharacterized protein n=1 Tax=Segatella salivae DSM 15606 TaxID=888832 RepID=E6MLR7_9BACT|nr:hypothetical protein HMPREF9420_0434 [Segatella salivae DSM 15606]